MLGVDETRARSVRWLLAESGWRRSDPWMTSFVDLDPAHPGGLLGLAPGRSGSSVRGWLDLQTPQFRAGVEVVAVDPSRRSPQRCATSSRTRRWWWTTGICTGSRT